MLHASTPALIVAAAMLMAACTPSSAPAPHGSSSVVNVDLTVTDSPTPTPTPSAQTVQQVIQSSRPYVVRIEANSCDLHGTTLGSGYLIDGKHVVTVAHVVENARGAGDYEDIAVRSIDRGVSKARIVGIDPAHDLALLELKSSLAVVASGAVDGLGFAQRPAVEGDPVVALGYPDGYPLSSFQGHVVGLNRSVTVSGRSLSGLLQFDASVTYGNSGGPVLTGQGQVVGLTEAVVDGTAALNLAITGISPYILTWMARPVPAYAPDCSWDAVGIQSTHAEASGIASTIVDWLTGSGRGYGTLFGDALTKAGSQQDYLDELKTVQRSQIVLLPTVKWVSETTDSAEITYRQSDAMSCGVFHQQLTMTSAMGFWRVSKVTDVEATRPC